MLSAVEKRVIALLSPDGDIDARLRIIQMRTIAENFRATAIANPIMAVVTGAIVLQWVSIWRIVPWLAAVLISVIIATLTSRHVLARDHVPADAGKLTLKMLCGMMPFNAVWPLIVIAGWVEGDANNNAFLVTFMFASMAAGIPLSAISRHFILANTVIDFPILATHAVGGSHHMMLWLGPLLQVIGGLFMYDLSFSFNKMYKTSVLERFEKEDLVQQLTQSGEKLKDAVAEAQAANKAKSAFLAGMSHELRTPLNAIIGFSDMIRNRMLGPVSPPRYGDYIEDIHTSGNHLLGLINNILDIAKIESGKRELTPVETSLRDLSEDALKLVEAQAEKKGVLLHTNIDNTFRLMADRRSIVQILTNLLSNAVKFTDAGGLVTVFARRIPGGGIALGVKDTGHGMDEDGLRKAFEPYGQVTDAMTVEGHGTGLGLTIVQSLLELHGATFHVKSARGEGTIAWGEFPFGRVIDCKAAA